MSPKIYNGTILVLFLALLVQTFLPKEVCPCECKEVQAPQIDTVYITKTDTLYLAADTIFQEKVVYKPAPFRQSPAPEPVPQVISQYSDTMQFDLEKVEVIFAATTRGTLEQIRIAARSTATKVVRITDTHFITQERVVEKKLYPNRFYLGGGIGGSKQMLDDISLGALYATNKNAYGLDYDLLDRTVQAKLYFKLF